VSSAKPERSLRTRTTCRQFGTLSLVRLLPCSHGSICRTPDGRQPRPTDIRGAPVGKSDGLSVRCTHGRGRLWPPSLGAVFMACVGRLFASTKGVRVSCIGDCASAASGVASSPVQLSCMVLEVFILALPPNQCIERTARQRCWRVPSALRAAAAAHAQR